MTAGEFITGSAWLAIILGAVILNFRSSKADKLAAERHKQEAASREQLAQQADLEEAAFVQKALAMLPDAESSLAHLKHRYGWREILESYGIHGLHLRLLRQTIDGGDIDLPNMDLLREDPEARRLLREAQSLASPPGWPEDVESLIQDPTVQTLLELQDCALVVAKPLGPEPTNKYSVSFTDTGRRLERLDTSFRDKGDRHPAWPNARPSMKIGRQVSRVVAAALNSRTRSAVS